MYYQLTCSCGTAHAVTKSQAGQSIACSCGKTLEIPTLRGLQELPKAEAPTHESAASTTAARAGGGQPAVVIGLLVLTFFVALGCLIFFGYTRLTMDTSQSEESERLAAFEAIDQAPPVVLSDAWDQYSSTALGPPTKPPFYYIQKKKNFNDLGVAISLAVLVISGLSAALTTLSKRPKQSPV